MTTVLVEGPMPPNGRDFCTPCMMLYKAEVVGTLTAEIRELETDGLDGYKTIRLQDHEPAGCRPPRLAAGIAMVNGNPQFGFVKVCWSHMMIPQTSTPSGVAVANTPSVDQAVAAMGLFPGRPGQRQ